MAIGDTNEPVGAPSLTPEEIIFLYQKYLQREPTATELKSEVENSYKYSAAGIERQIANRAGNVAGSGVRGDEGLAPLTVPYVPPPPVIRPDVIGSVITMGASAIPYGPGPSGPTGSVYPTGAYAPASYFPAAGVGGLSMTTLLLLAALAAAAYYVLVVRR